MSSIFISYRRDDSEGQAGRLYDDLVAEFGREAVFMDVAAIRPGADFRKSIDQSLSSCGVFLSVIGTRWLSAEDGVGHRRIDDPADFVRIETAMALKRDIPLIPVLVQGAQAPQGKDLPPDLADLAFRNAIELRHARWEADVQMLVQHVRSHLAERPPAPAPMPAVPHGPPPAMPMRGTAVALWGGAAALVAVGLLYVALGWHRAPEPMPSEPVATRPAAAALADPGDAILAELKLTASKRARGEVDAAGRPRHDYALSIMLPPALLEHVKGVHYDLIYEANPLSIDGRGPPSFTAGYEGWGCYTNVDVSVAYEVAGARRSVTKRFDMCQAMALRY